MTLDTRIFVHDQVEPHTVFHYCRELLGATDDHPYEDRPSTWGREPGEWSIGNHAGIGLPALLDVRYRPNEPLRPDADACCDYCDPGDDYHSHRPAMWCEVSFDTTYGYTDPQGRGCGDLHACYVAQFGQWLDERGIAWSWENEFTGEVHGGADRYARLVDLMSGGADATAWFKGTVLPALRSEYPGLST